MLRVSVARLEARTGPARQVADAGNGFARRGYLVQGCAVDAFVKDGQVESYAVPLTPDCSVDLSPFLAGRRAPSADRMAVGDFLAVAGPGSAPDAAGAFRSACLVDCRGAGGDPEVSYLRRSSEAEGFPEIEVTAAVDDYHSRASADRFVRILRDREDEEYVREARFSCDGRHAAEGVREFSAIPLSRVRVGYGIDASGAWLLAKCPNLRG